MSTIEAKNTLVLGKGAVLRMYEDTSKTLQSGERFYTEAEYDGEESSWVIEVGMHWHKQHDERIQVLKGRISMYLHGKWSTITPQSGVVFVPRRVTHAFKFFKGEPTAVRERTEPSGEFKQMFFQDAFGDGEMKFWKAMAGFAEGDGYVALPLGIGILDEAFTIVAGTIGRFFYPRAKELGSGMPPAK